MVGASFAEKERLYQQWVRGTDCDETRTYGKPGGDDFVGSGVVAGGGAGYAG